MSNSLIIEPVAIQAGWLSATTEAAAFPVSQLTDPQPLEVWQAAASGDATIDIDLQSDTAVDTVFLGYTNASAAAVWTVRAATDAQGAAHLDDVASLIKTNGPIRASTDALGPRYHGFWHGAEVSPRWLRLNLFDAAAALSAGVLVVGKAFRPTYNHEWQSGRAPVDLSRKERLSSGAMSVDKRAIFADWRWTLGDLTDEEARELWAIARRVGESSPILVVEDPDGGDGLHERLHYGTLKDLQEYAREAPQKTRWEFTIEEWL